MVILMTLAPLKSASTSAANCTIAVVGSEVRKCMVHVMPRCGFDEQPMGDPYSVRTFSTYACRSAAICALNSGLGTCSMGCGCHVGCAEAVWKRLNAGKRVHDVDLASVVGSGEAHGSGERHSTLLMGIARTAPRGGLDTSRPASILRCLPTRSILGSIASRVKTTRPGRRDTDCVGRVRPTQTFSATTGRIRPSFRLRAGAENGRRSAASSSQGPYCGWHARCSAR